VCCGEKFNPSEFCAAAPQARKFLDANPNFGVLFNFYCIRGLMVSGERAARVAKWELPAARLHDLQMAKVSADGWCLQMAKVSDAYMQGRAAQHPAPETSYSGHSWFSG
jgi:hypothetical protein